MLLRTHPIVLAPEQIQKHPIRASDQYALGITVYEWLCGRPPFEGDWYNLYHQHLNVLPQPLRERIPEIPSAVETVVLKALAKKPEERFGSVSEFATNLQACLKVSAVDPKEDISTSPRLYRSSDIPASKPMVALKDYTDWVTTPLEALVVLSTPSSPSSSSTMSSYDPRQLESVSEHSRLEQRRREAREKRTKAIWRLSQIVMFFPIGIAAIGETAFAHVAVEAGLPWSSFWWSGWSWWWNGGRSDSQDIMFAATIEGVVFTSVYFIVLYSIYNDSDGGEDHGGLWAFLSGSMAVAIMDAPFMLLSPLTTNLDWQMLGVAFLATIFMGVLVLVVDLVNTFMRSHKRNGKESPG